MIIVLPRKRLSAVIEENKKKREEKERKDRELGKLVGEKKHRKRIMSIEELYPKATIIDVTSNSADENYQKLSPFYPHRGIPVPFSPNWVSASVEGIWQGLKVFQMADIDTSLFKNTSMKGLKRSIRRFGPILGHRKGVSGRKDDLLGAVDARRYIYAPAYRWVLENKVSDVVDKIRKLALQGDVILVDYNTNCDINIDKPLSHAGLIKAFIEGTYPEAPSLEENPLSPELQQRLPVGCRVKHAQFGIGRITDIQGTKAKVSFRFEEKTIELRANTLEPYEGIESVEMESNGKKVTLLQNRHWLWGVQADSIKKIESIPCEYEEICFYSAKLVEKQKNPIYYFLVKKDGYWGVLNRKGHQQAPCIYDELQPKENDGFWEGFAFRRGRVIGTIDGKGKEKVSKKEGSNYIEKYIWLVEFLLREDGATFNKIAEKWRKDERVNPGNKNLSRSTFNKMLAAIPKMLHINIVHSKKPGDHKYKVDNYHGQLDHLLYSNVSLNAKLDRDKKLRGRILFEREPQVAIRWLEDIADAMSRGKKIMLDYKKYGDAYTTQRKIAPYCLKMFRRRWYLLADDGGMERTFALDDRLKGLNVLDETFTLPEGFDAAAHFRYAYGITMVGEPQTVTIKAFGKEAAYWRSAPFHPTQREIETGEDYAVFSFFLSPEAPEFIHALLSHGATIEVLEPATLRDTIIAKIDEMCQRYS